MEESELPPEIMLEIASYLSPKEQLRLERVSRSFQEISQSLNVDYLKNVIQFLPNELISKIFDYLSLQDARRIFNTSASIRRIVFPFYLEKFIKELNSLIELEFKIGNTGEISLFKKDTIPTKIEHKIETYEGLQKEHPEHNWEDRHFYSVIPDIWIGQYSLFDLSTAKLYKGRFRYFLVDATKFPDISIDDVINSGRAATIKDKEELRTILELLSDEYYAGPEKFPNSRKFERLIRQYNPYPIQYIVTYLRK